MVVVLVVVVLLMLIGMLLYRDVKGVRHGPRAVDPRALEHAERASEQLRIVEGHLRAVANLDEMRRLEFVASGGVKQYNAEVDTTIELARTHALTALAFIGYPMGSLEGSGDTVADKDGVRELVSAGPGRGFE
jgi:hypothetical protein